MAFCLVATLFAFVATSVESHLELEERSSEMVELEESLTPAVRKERRRRRAGTKLSWISYQSLSGVYQSIPLRLCQVTPPTERDSLNGNGSYLLT